MTSLMYQQQRGCAECWIRRQGVRSSAVIGAFDLPGASFYEAMNLRSLSLVSAVSSAST